LGVATAAIGGAATLFLREQFHSHIEEKMKQEQFRPQETRRVEEKLK
jgi:hypothetical protein